MVYKNLIDQVKALTEGIPYPIANLANTAAAIWQNLDRLNWAGFYLMQDGALVLGPFQGKPACIRIPVGKGVCGTAVQDNRTIRVEDVHQFPGHIACDCASNSEIVIPIYKNGEIYGVLDLDSPYFARFTEEDQTGLEAVVRVLEEAL